MTSLEKGLTCKLTNRKPEFNNTCTKIKLDKKFQEKLETTNLDLERIRETKNSVYSTFYILIIIGFLLIIGGDALAKWTIKSVFVLETKIWTIIIGISFLGAAYKKLNGFRRNIKDAEFDKNEIDDLLKKYGIEYKADISFKEKVHGIQEVNVELEFKNWAKKRTSTTYEIKPSL